MITRRELEELFDRAAETPAPRLTHWPFPPPPAFYECDCGARYPTHEALCACAARGHK
jgi:hypothetical protein